MGYDEESKDYREQLDLKDSESTRQTEGFRNDRENLVDLSYLVNFLITSLLVLQPQRLKSL